MIEILQTFAAGITFAIGVGVGAMLCRMATKDRQSDSFDASIIATQKRMEDRLSGSLYCHQRMADAMAAIVEELRERQY